MPPPVTVYLKQGCPYSRRAVDLLRRKGLHPELIDVEASPRARSEMIDRSQGRSTVPQVFIGSHHVGGSDDLEAANRSGELDGLLAQSEHASP